MRSALAAQLKAISGGNLTGISMSESAMADKQIEMLHEIVPRAELMVSS